MLQRLIISFCFLLVLHKTRAQIVSIEEFRKITDSSGIVGNAGVAGSYINGEEELSSLNINADLQYKPMNGKDLYLFLLDYSLTRSGKTNFQNSSFLHFRYNRKWSKVLRFEAFTQVQEDKVLLLKSRFLAGAGLRIKALETKSVKLYSGTIPMLEFERTADSLPGTTGLRLSQYLSTTIKLSETAKLIATCYYQPAFKDFNDYRFLVVGKLSSPITKKFALTLMGRYLWDEEPPLKAPKRFVTVSAGLNYKFN